MIILQVIIILIPIFIVADIVETYGDKLKICKISTFL